MINSNADASEEQLECKGLVVVEKTCRSGCDPAYGGKLPDTCEASF